MQTISNSFYLAFAQFKRVCTWVVVVPAITIPMDEDAMPKAVEKVSDKWSYRVGWLAQKNSTYSLLVGVVYYSYFYNWSIFLPKKYPSCCQPVSNFPPLGDVKMWQGNQTDA